MPLSFFNNKNNFNAVDVMQKILSLNSNKKIDAFINKLSISSVNLQSLIKTMRDNLSKHDDGKVIYALDLLQLKEKYLDWPKSYWRYGMRKIEYV